ncbi:uncharacterized protein LOC135492971 [Lineus longissimus]|uniref:uncharacterized protein LOC135492971 n=1 Tax=Lineus longissimus TaxID=88925 RepID=UPI00315C8D98
MSDVCVGDLLVILLLQMVLSTGGFLPDAIISVKLNDEDPSVRLYGKVSIKESFIFGRVLSIDRQNGCATVPQVDILATGEFSVAVFIKLRQNNWPQFLKFEVDNYIVSIQFHDFTLRLVFCNDKFNVRVTGCLHYVTTAITSGLGHWQFLVGCFKNKSKAASIYIDGKTVRVREIYMSGYPANNGVEIGCAGFLGLISEVVVFPVVLTSLSVMEIYQKFIGRKEGLPIDNIFCKSKRMPVQTDAILVRSRIDCTVDCGIWNWFYIMTKPKCLGVHS